MSTESSDIKGIAENLTRQAWATGKDLFENDLLVLLAAEARQHQASQILNPASVGHNETRTFSSIRGDSTLWLDDPRCGEASKKFLDALHFLKENLNQSLFLGLESVEAHFAVYPAGAAYTRHRDRFRDDDSRVVSLVCYLNADWPEDAGGALRMHLEHGPIDVAPKLGTSVIFLSEEIEHEVLPATQIRYSLAAWFRRRPLQIR